MSTLIDLDAFVPENKTVKLGGSEFVLPGDLPMETFLRINATQSISDGEDADGAKTLEALLGVMGDLFAWVYPESEKAAIKDRAETVLRGRGIRFLMDLVQHTYREDEKPEVEAEAGAEAEAEDPTPSPTTGTPST